MLRWLTVGLLLVATAPAAPAAVQAEQTLDLEGLRLAIYRDNVVVSVRRDIKGSADPDGVPLQVWVLRSDGTSLKKQKPEQTPISYITGNMLLAATENWTTNIPFERAHPRDLAAIVVMDGDRLFIRPIPEKPAN